MSAQGRPAGLTAWAVLSRATVWVVLVAVFAMLAFAVVLWPALLGVLVGGAVLGLLLRFAVERRRARGSDPVRPVSRRTARRDRGPRLLVTVGGLVAMIAVIAVIIVMVVGLSGLALLGPDGGFAPPPQPTHRVPYRAVLEFQDEGDWSGQEWFTLKPAEAKRVVRAGKASLVSRLRAAVPPGWNVLLERTGNATEYRIQRDYPSQPFEVPSWRPLKTLISLPAPELHSPDFRHPLFAADGSTVTLHAPEHRIYSTRPSSKVSAEASGRVERIVKLEIIGTQPAGKDVEVEIESDLATNLPQELIGLRTLLLIGLILTSLGVTPATAPGKVKRGLKWLLHVTRSDEPKRTKSVLRGKPSKNAALISYLEGRKLAPEDVRSAAALVVHQARTFASEAIANSSDPNARSTYDVARRRLTEEGKLPEMDVVYTALQEAGISSGELDALDTTLDKEIIAAQEGTPQPPGHS